MSIEMKLQMRLSQQLIMTPQLQQAIKLLQLSRSELEELIDQALIENPVLEEGLDIDNAEPQNKENESEGETETPQETPAAEVQEPFESIKETEKEELNTEELDWQQYLEFGGTGYEGRRNHDEDAPSVEATLAQGKSLTDHLLWQLDMLQLSPLEHEIGRYIIGNIDEAGYLSISVKDLLESKPVVHAEVEEWCNNNWADQNMEMPETLELRHLTEKNSSKEKPSNQPPVFEEDLPEEVEEDVVEQREIMAKSAHYVEGVLQLIQQFEPNGVGARSLQECLLIQLRGLNMEDSLCYRIINNDMPLLESKDLKKIARRHKEDIENIKDAWRLIISLEPKPGRVYTPSSSHHIIPDVYIYKFSGEYKVALNESGIPRLRISQYYKQLADNMEVEKGNLDKEYIQEKIKSGQWLMKSIEQRQKTIFRVTEGILKFQKEFFDKGIHFLKPLVLKTLLKILMFMNQQLVVLPPINMFTRLKVFLN